MALQYKYWDKRFPEGLHDIVKEKAITLKNADFENYWSAYFPVWDGREINDRNFVCNKGGEFGHGRISNLFEHIVDPAYDLVFLKVKHSDFFYVADEKLGPHIKERWIGTYIYVTFNGYFDPHKFEVKPINGDFSNKSLKNCGLVALEQVDSRKKVTLEDEDRIIRLYQEGKKYDDIAKVTQISKSTVTRKIRKWKQTNH